jgi:hypothetical protein
VAANEILIWTGTDWTRVTPSKGMATLTEDDYKILVYTTSWVGLATLVQAANVAAAAMIGKIKTQATLRLRESLMTPWSCCSC